MKCEIEDFNRITIFNNMFKQFLTIITIYNILKYFYFKCYL